MDVEVRIEAAQETLGYVFRDPALLITALTHASCADQRILSNERLEFLGDAVLGMVVCEELYRRYDDWHEGDLTKVKSIVVSRRTCAKIADDLDLRRCMHLGKGIGDLPTLPISLRAAVLESVIGAIYIDGGLDPAKAFILQHARPHIDKAVEPGHQVNHKSNLQHYVQRALSATPQYLELDEQGPDHSKCFEVCVLIDGKRFPSAWGPNKKQAEQEAARRALEYLTSKNGDPRAAGRTAS